MMQIISDIYEKIFPALTAGPNVLVQFDWSTSAILEEDREGGYPNSENKVPKKAAEIIDSFLEPMSRTCQKFCSRQAPFNYARSAVKEVSYILFPHRYASRVHLDREPALWQFTPQEKEPRGRKVLS